MKEVRVREHVNKQGDIILRVQMLLDFFHTVWKLSKLIPLLALFFQNLRAQTDCCIPSRLQAHSRRQLPGMYVIERTVVDVADSQLREVVDGCGDIILE